MKPLFIVFEGPDGSGLSTQANMLTKWFESKGKKVLLTKEPTNSLVGGVIRTILKKEWKVNMETFGLLFAADRSHHLDTEINPALEKGYNVICDRYILSNLAFNSERENIEWLKSLNSPFRKPDFTFVMDIKGDICLQRIKKSRFGMELFEDSERLDKVMENYRKLRDYFPNTFFIKADSRSPEEIHREIVEILEKHKI